MTLLDNVKDLQLKLGNFVDERHEGVRCSSLSPSSKLEEIQQSSVNTFAILVGKYSLVYTQQTHLLNMKKSPFFFKTHPLKLVCVFNTEILK